MVQNTGLHPILEIFWNFKRNESDLYVLTWENVHDYLNEKANVMKYVTIEGKNTHMQNIHAMCRYVWSWRKKQHTHIGFSQGFVGEEEIVFILFLSHFTVFKRKHSFIKFTSNTANYKNSKTALESENFFPFNNFFIFPLKKKKG